ETQADLHHAPLADNTFNRVTAKRGHGAHYRCSARVPFGQKAATTHRRFHLSYPKPLALHHVSGSHLVPQRLKNKIIKFAEGRDEDEVFPTFYRVNTTHSIQMAAPEAALHTVSTSSAAMLMLLGPLVVFDLLFRRLTRWIFLRTFAAVL